MCRRGCVVGTHRVAARGAFYKSQQRAHARRTPPRARAPGTRLALLLRMAREPDVADALERTYEAGQTLIAGRVDLLLAEARLLLHDGRALGVAGLVAVAGWLFLMLGVIDG